MYKTVNSPQFDFLVKPNETEYQYRWRIYQAKASGLLEDMSWVDIASEIDAALRPEEPPYSESVYRKEAALIQKWYENVFAGAANQDAACDNASMKELLTEIGKEKIRLHDERVEYNRQLRQETRFEERLSILENAIREMGKERFPSLGAIDYPAIDINNEEKSMLVLLSDWHIGAKFDSCLGEYDNVLAKKRLEALMDKTVSTGKNYNIKCVYVALLGDMISGNIHNSIRISNSENVIEQVKTASDYVDDFLYQLAEKFNLVYVTSVCGNHSRLENKEMAVKDERLDDLISFISKKSLFYVDNIVWDPEEKVDSTISYFNIRGKRYVFVHGDNDVLSESGVSRLTMALRSRPDYICMGHEHTPAYSEISGIGLVRGGSLCGSGDDYTVAHRMIGNPSQTILICGKDGVEAMLPVNLK